MGGDFNLGNSKGLFDARRKGGQIIAEGVGQQIAESVEYPVVPHEAPDATVQAACGPGRAGQPGRQDKEARPARNSQAKT